MSELADRIRYTETEYSPRNFSLKDPLGPGAAEAAQAYRVDPETDRVSVRTEWLPQILKNRQYAAVLGDRALAAAMPDVRKMANASSSSFQGRLQDRRIGPMDAAV